MFSASCARFSPAFAPYTLRGLDLCSLVPGLPRGERSRTVHRRALCAGDGPLVAPKPLPLDGGGWPCEALAKQGRVRVSLLQSSPFTVTLTLPSPFKGEGYNTNHIPAQRFLAPAAPRRARRSSRVFGGVGDRHLFSHTAREKESVPGPT